MKVYCPVCGVGVIVHPRVKGIENDERSQQLEVEFEYVVVTHLHKED